MGLMEVKTEIELLYYCYSVKVELTIDAGPILVHLSIAELQEQARRRQNSKDF